MRNSSDMISVTPHGTVFLLDNVEVKTCRSPRVTGPADFRIGSVVKVSRTRAREGGEVGHIALQASQSQSCNHLVTSHTPPKWSGERGKLVSYFILKT